MNFSTAMVFITDKYLRILVIARQAMAAVVRAQCPEPIVIQKRTGQIKSPNLGSEYGKMANCTWKFSSTEWTNYALKLDVLYLRLYYTSGGSKECVTGSYNLTIAADRLKCDKFARKRNNVTFCHSYYNSYTCGNISGISDCDVSKPSKFPVEVKYEADGRTIPGVSVNGFGGFRMRYQFVECPEFTPTMGNGIGTTTVSKDISQQVATTGNGIGSTTISKNTSKNASSTTVENTESLSSTTSTGSRQTTTNEHESSTTTIVETTERISSTSSRETTTNDESDRRAPPTLSTTGEFPIPTVAGAAAGGALFLVLVIVIAICMKRRSLLNRKPLDESELTRKDQDIMKETTHYDKEMVDNVLYGTINDVAL